MDAPTWRDLPKMLITFALVVFGWILFRAESISQFAEYVQGICNASLFTVPWLKNRAYYIPLAIAIVILLLGEWYNKNAQHGLDLSKCKYKAVRWLIYFFLIEYTIMNGGTAETFIYFQF